MAPVRGLLVSVVMAGKSSPRKRISSQMGATMQPSTRILAMVAGSFELRSCSLAGWDPPVTNRDRMLRMTSSKASTGTLANRPPIPQASFSPMRLNSIPIFFAESWSPRMGTFIRTMRVMAMAR